MACQPSRDAAADRTPYLLFLAAVAVRELWAWLLPLDAGNDEIFHLYTARLYAWGAAVAAAPAGGFFHPAYRFSELPYLSHPPGVYLLGAAVLRLVGAGGGAYLWLRQVPVLCGAAAVPVAYVTLRRFWRRPAALPLAVAFLLALGPQWVFATSYFSSDALGLLAAATAYLAAALLLRDAGPGAPAGAAGSLAALAASPPTCWPAAAAILTAGALRWVRWSRVFRALFLGTLVVPLLLTVGWRAVRQRAFPQPRAAAAGAVRPESYLPGFPVAGSQGRVPARHPYLYRYGLGYLARSTFLSFWGVFGYMGLLMPAAYYAWWAAFCLAAALGLAARVARARGQPLAAHPALPWLAAAGAPLLLILLGHVYVNLLEPGAPYQPQGRYLFGALVPILTFLCLGLQALLRAFRRERWLLPLCLVSAAAANAWCLWVVVTAPWARVVWAP